MLQVRYTGRAAKQISRLPREASKDLRAMLEQLAEDPGDSTIGVESLKGAAGYKIRVGEWRAVVAISSDTITVLEVGHRGTIYKRRPRK